MKPPFPPSRPPWWPPDEPWPPAGPPGRNMWRLWRSQRWRHQDWRRQRWHGPFFWRVAGLLIFLLVFTLGGCALALGLVADNEPCRRNET